MLFTFEHLRERTNCAKPACGSIGVYIYIYLRAKIVIVTGINELKIIIFVLYYLTVLVCTKTIHLNAGGQWWIFTLPLRGSVNIHR